MKKKKEKLTKLDLSFGPDVKDGFKKFFDDGFLVTDKGSTWPIKDNSVEEAYSAFMFCRIPGKNRPHFMDELYRVLVPGGKVLIIVPYWSSARAIQDFTHEWPPVVEQSFLYFNKEWRNNSGAGNYPVKCDFDFTFGYALEQETQTKNTELQSMYVKRYNNTVLDLHVTLTKKA